MTSEAKKRGGFEIRYQKSFQEIQGICRARGSVATRKLVN